MGGTVGRRGCRCCRGRDETRFGGRAFQHERRRLRDIKQSRLCVCCGLLNRGTCRQARVKPSGEHRLWPAAECAFGDDHRRPFIPERSRRRIERRIARARLNDGQADALVLRQEIAEIRRGHAARGAARILERQRAVSCRGAPARVPDEMHDVTFASEPLLQRLFGGGNHAIESDEVLSLESFQCIGQILPGAFGVERRRVGGRGDDGNDAEWLPSGSCSRLRRLSRRLQISRRRRSRETATPQPGQKRASGMSPRPHWVQKPAPANAGEPPTPGGNACWPLTTVSYSPLSTHAEKLARAHHRPGMCLPHRCSAPSRTSSASPHRTP